MSNYVYVIDNTSVYKTNVVKFIISLVTASLYVTMSVVIFKYCNHNISFFLFIIVSSPSIPHPPAFFHNCFKAQYSPSTCFLFIIVSTCTNHAYYEYYTINTSKLIKKNKKTNNYQPFHHNFTIIIPFPHPGTFIVIIPHSGTLNWKPIMTDRIKKTICRTMCIN